MNDFSDIFESNPGLKPLMDLVNEIVDLPDDFSDEKRDAVVNLIKSSLSDADRENAIHNIILEFKDMRVTKTQCHDIIETFMNTFSEYLDSLNVSTNKKAILDCVYNIFKELFEDALEQYSGFSINLLIKLDEGAQIPTYAHETDAAADLYAADTITVPAHSISNMIRTGVHIALPTNWMAMIVPRSSIGSKTGLRLSNSVGIIDSQYRGPLGVLYDNISDSDYTINAGDRIAQLLVFPSYRFNAQVVDILPATERGEDGFGSTGK